jgi:hypothetical protein
VALVAGGDAAEFRSEERWISQFSATAKPGPTPTAVKGKEMALENPGATKAMRIKVLPAR